MVEETNARRESHVVADPGAVATFLGAPSTHGAGICEAARIDTHGAMVFLAGDRAYKVKRAVRFPYMDFSTLARRGAACAREVADLLDRRGAQGFVRRCHGVLHLRNVCLIDGRPTLFDAIEFNDAIACVDLLYDLAFLLMDLEQRGLRAEANLVLNRHVRDEADLAGLAALPCFLSCRAASATRASRRSAP